MATDPFTLVYEALRGILEGNADFARVVKKNNRMFYVGPSRRPEKDVPQDSDRPEVRLAPSGGEAHLGATSSSSKIVKRFRIEVATGDMRVDERLFPVQWSIYRAMAGWQAVLTALTWNSKAFVVTSKLSAVSEGLSESDLSQGVRGWAAVWECEIEMWFTTSDLTGS